MQRYHRYMGMLVVLLFCGLPLTRAQDMVKAGGEPIDNSVEVSKLTYDILVDGNLDKDDPQHNQFKTFQAAYAAAPEGTESKPTVIGIKPNVYQITGSMERGASLNIRKNWITLLGLTNNRRSVVLADNRGLQEGASDDGFLLDVNATGFTVKNLTILNYCNCDYEYPGNPSKNLKMRNPTITQAVALQAAGDKHVYENVAILSRLDTMFLQTTRSYFKNVYIEGTDDWMGGGQMSVWEDSELVYSKGYGVMSASGIVFIHCKFDAPRGMQFFKAEYGGAARPVALINCTVSATTPPAKHAWVRGTTSPRPNYQSLTYHVKDSNGNPAIFSSDSESNVSAPYSRELADQEVLAYNPWNLLRTTTNGRADDWDPAGVKEKYAKDGDLPYRVTLSIRNGPAGRGGGLDPSAVSMSVTVRTGGPGATIGAAVVPSTAADKTITWSTDSKVVSLSRSTGPNVVVTGQNTTEEAQYVPIIAKSSNGFYATAYVYVEPKFIDPPAVTIAPRISAPAKGKVSAEYTLDLGGREDESVITWFACDDAAGANPRKVAVSRGNQPLKTYMLATGDIGKFVRVSVEPKHRISEPGPAVYAMATAPITASDLISPNVEVSFRNFVEAPSTDLINGRWTVVGPWTAVANDALTGGYGVRAGGASGGGPSSLIYVKDGDTGDMQVDIELREGKTEGTVFAIPGSPDDAGRGSHGDIYIKYDPRTKNGYSLRYWRTTQSAAACMFQFYKIENGTSSPLNDKQILSGVFKPNTIATLKTQGTTISFTAHNTADNLTLSLEGTINPNHFGSAGVSSSGAATIYSMMKISYP